MKYKLPRGFPAVLLFVDRNMRRITFQFCKALCKKPQKAFYQNLGQCPFCLLNNLAKLSIMHEFTEFCSNEYLPFVRLKFTKCCDYMDLGKNVMVTVEIKDNINTIKLGFDQLLET
ncbi:hypothetical protein MAR_002541 [Mya arenaria]|uniref:Uncharacterized protein n=1 Tax=Mya arenaria TaxID=6604 RepID=A0ABY7G6Z3_MYAAR|nr:hypothetical protein MAR_002541 [Mya arenaria]